MEISLIGGFCIHEEVVSLIGKNANGKLLSGRNRLVRCRSKGSRRAAGHERACALAV